MLWVQFFTQRLKFALFQSIMGNFTFFRPMGAKIIYAYLTGIHSMKFFPGRNLCFSMIVHDCDCFSFPFILAASEEYLYGTFLKDVNGMGERIEIEICEWEETTNLKYS